MLSKAYFRRLRLFRFFQLFSNIILLFCTFYININSNNKYYILKNKTFYGCYTFIVRLYCYNVFLLDCIYKS